MRTRGRPARLLTGRGRAAPGAVIHGREAAPGAVIRGRAAAPGAAVDGQGRAAPGAVTQPLATRRSSTRAGGSARGGAGARALPGSGARGAAGLGVGRGAAGHGARGGGTLRSGGVGAAGARLRHLPALPSASLRPGRLPRPSLTAGLRGGDGPGAALPGVAVSGYPRPGRCGLRRVRKRHLGRGLAGRAVVTQGSAVPGALHT